MFKPWMSSNGTMTHQFILIMMSGPIEQPHICIFCTNASSPSKDTIFLKQYKAYDPMAITLVAFLLITLSLIVITLLLMINGGEYKSKL